jgi:hypothetical protein
MTEGPSEQSITINDLRRGWQKTIEQHDAIIAWLEGDGTILLPGQEDAQVATRAWLKKVREWRAELEMLLQTYPAEG